MIDLITGHQGMAHITAEQISDINNAMMDGYGVDKVMRLDGGDVTLDGLSLVIEVGYWRVNGFDMEIKEEETLYFDPTVGGVSRIDDVYVEILQDITDGYQRAVLVIVQGEPDVSPVAPDEPTTPELNTDILLQIVHVARCTISSGAMTVSDKTIVYKYVSPEDLTSITIKGSTNNTGSTIASGTYFYLNGDLVKAKISIANGATLTLNTNYEIPTAGALNALNSALTWKSLGTIDATTTTLALPSSYKELNLMFTFGGNVRTFIYLLKEAIGGSDRVYRTGYWASSTANASCSISINTTNGFHGLNVLQNGSTVSASCEIFYR